MEQEKEQQTLDEFNEQEQIKKLKMQLKRMKERLEIYKRRAINYKRQLAVYKAINTQQQKQELKPQSQQGMGFLLGFFLGFLGLIIGLCLYRDDFEKRTFVRGWLFAFIVFFALVLLLIGILFLAGVF